MTFGSTIGSVLSLISSRSGAWPSSSAWKQTLPTSKNMASFFYNRRTRIVGRQRQPPVSVETPVQIAQIRCSAADVLINPERVIHIEQLRSARHQLHHASRPLARYRTRVPIALDANHSPNHVRRNAILR